ncbi:MAG: hypothetical protein WBG86_14875 [Polyangiales bacterium]
MRRVLSYLAATCVGVFLLVTPFLRYGAGGGHAHALGPHADHGARHGGHLFMLRDHHLELVEHEDSIELFLSDVMRRPVRPTSCEVIFESAGRASCAWDSYRYVVAKPTSGSHASYRLTIPDGPPLAWQYP